MAIKIGFDSVETVNIDKVSEEKKAEVKRVFEKKEVYIPPNRIEELLKDFDCVVVNSFGDGNDDYHLSEEERAKNNEYYVVFNKIRRMKKIYRRLKEYVIAVREMLHALDIVAETNGVYDPDEFKKMYYKGEIEISGIKFPKYKGRDRKKISWDYLTEFIFSKEDPSNIVDRGVDDMGLSNIELSEEERRKRYFSDDEWDRVNKPLSNDETKYEIELFDVNKDDVGNTNTIVNFDSRESKKLIRKNPELAHMIKDIHRKKKLKRNINSAYRYTDSIYEDIEKIEEYDQRYQYKSKNDVPEFHGDLIGDRDFYKYMEKLDDYEHENIKKSYEGKMRTIGEIKEMEIKHMMEEAGWNILKFASNRRARDIVKKDIKNYREKQKRVKDKLIALKNRRDRKERTLQDSDKLDKEIRKLKKKKRTNKDKVDKLEKKLKDARKKKGKTKENTKSRKEMIDHVEEGIKESLLAARHRKEESFNDWEESALDMTSIFDE